MIFDVQKGEQQYPGSSGLPEHYPTPPQSDKLLFYIQRNHNLNTVIYEINYNESNQINADHPMHAYWVKYNTGGDIEDLNYYQNKMAYGYNSSLINHNTFEFSFVSYAQLKLFIAANHSGKYEVYCRINSQMSVLHNIYVYAEELGVFPNVKFIELFGSDVESNVATYQRINLDL